MIDRFTPTEFPQRASFGGDVADLLETLKAKETGEPYKDSLNPYGNPFERMSSVEDMIRSFSSAHFGSHDLDILLQALDSFYEALNKKESKVYATARQEVLKLLQKKAQAAGGQTEAV